VNDVLVKRLGVLIFVLVIVVFGTEATLARLRRRDVTVHVSVNAALAPTPVGTLIGTAIPATATPDPLTPTLTPTPGPLILNVSPADQVIVDVQWDYSIGPRFPHTVIHASALISGRDVADGEVRIDCGTAAMSCKGSQQIALRYTIPDVGSGSQQIGWPPGDYKVAIDRSEGGLTPLRIQETTFRVQ